MPVSEEDGQVLEVNFMEFGKVFYGVFVQKNKDDFHPTLYGNIIFNNEEKALDFATQKNQEWGHVLNYKVESIREVK